METGHQIELTFQSKVEYLNLVHAVEHPAHWFGRWEQKMVDAGVQEARRPRPVHPAMFLRLLGPVEWKTWDRQGVRYLRAEMNWGG